MKLVDHYPSIIQDRAVSFYLQLIADILSQCCLQVYTLSSSDDAVIDLRSPSRNLSRSTAGQDMAVERIDLASDGCENTTQHAGAEAESANLLPNFLRATANSPQGSGHGAILISNVTHVDSLNGLGPNRPPTCAWQLSAPVQNVT